MKKLLLVSLFIGLATFLWSQEQTLLGKSRVPVGGFGGFHSHMGLMDNGFVSAGGFGAVTFGDLFLGGFGYGADAKDAFTFENKTYNKNMGVGGFMIGYVYPNHKLVHLYSHVKLGWGGVALFDPDTKEEFFTEDIFSVLPEVGLELNVTFWFRIAATVGYQFTTGIDQNPYVDQSDFIFPTAGISFKFGKFSQD